MTGALRRACRSLGPGSPRLSGGGIVYTAGGHQGGDFDHTGNPAADRWGRRRTSHSEPDRACLPVRGGSPASECLTARVASDERAGVQASDRRISRVTSAKLSVLSLFLTLWRTENKRPCRNSRQGRILHNRGGEIRTRDLLNPIRLAVHALTCIQLISRAFRRSHLRTLALIPPHFVTATVTVLSCDSTQKHQRPTVWPGASLCSQGNAE